jgi:uncharacterized phage protein gp47/JayE
MPSSFVTLTLDQLHEILIASYAGWFPNDDVSEHSDNWTRLRVVALAWAGDQHQIQVGYDDLLPDSATGIRLDRWGTILNVLRKLATPAKKAKALRCTGAAGSTVGALAALVHTDGTRYQVSAPGTIPGGGTFIDVDIVAIDTGSATRKNKGELLTFSGSPPVGIDPQASLVLDLDEDGDDKELDGDYRVRVLEKIAQPGMGGNANDYKVWALEVTGVSTAFVFAGRGGYGSVHLAAFHSGSGALRALTVSERAEVQAYIDSKRPVSVRDFLVLTTAAELTDVEVRVLPEDGDAFKFDWDDVTVPPGVFSYTAGTRTVKLTGPRPADLAAGMRVVWRSTAGTFHNGSEVVVEALGVAADEFILRPPGPGEYDWTATPPVSGNALLSGGPLVAPIRAAILALIDSLGPARGAFATGAWVGTLYTSQLFKVVQTSLGVLDSTITAPVSNTTPANVPPGPSVGYLVPRQIIVRHA